MLRLLGIPPRLILPAFFNLRTCCVPEDPSILHQGLGHELVIPHWKQFLHQVKCQISKYIARGMAEREGLIQVWLCSFFSFFKMIMNSVLWGFAFVSCTVWYRRCFHLSTEAEASFFFLNVGMRNVRGLWWWVLEDNSLWACVDWFSWWSWRIRVFTLQRLNAEVQQLILWVETDDGGDKWASTCSRLATGSWMGGCSCAWRPKFYGAHCEPDPRNPWTDVLWFGWGLQSLGTL